MTLSSRLSILYFELYADASWLLPTNLCLALFGQDLGLIDPYRLIGRAHSAGTKKDRVGHRDLHYSSTVALDNLRRAEEARFKK